MIVKKTIQVRGVEVDVIHLPGWKGRPEQGRVLFNKYLNNPGKMDPCGIFPFVPVSSEQSIPGVHTIKIVHFQRYSMEVTSVLITLLGVNVLHARFIPSQ